jgi:hypothetical protein
MARIVLKGCGLPLLRLAASGTSNPGLTGCRTASDRKRTYDPQTLRYPRSEATPDLLGANPCCCLEGRCHRRRHHNERDRADFVVYEVSQIVAHARTTATSRRARPAKGAEHRRRTRTAYSMTVRGPDSPGSTPRSGRAYPGGRGHAWSARAFVAIILAIVAIALVIWFALGA